MKKNFLLSIFFSMITITKLSAGCCAAQEGVVVNQANVVIGNLKQYNAELDKSVKYSRAAVQEAMAVTLEKERVLNELYAMKKNTELRADLKSAIAQELLVQSEAKLHNLQMDYGADTEKELEQFEKKE
ncbi:MAG: hypothetical protein PHT07_10550 [Paludibacter sp.]|nr:hypothetical protein [Paludibacter sp.]